jgi:hypothetical protein
MQQLSGSCACRIQQPISIWMHLSLADCVSASNSSSCLTALFIYASPGYGVVQAYSQHHQTAAQINRQ